MNKTSLKEGGITNDELEEKYGREKECIILCSDGYSCRTSKGFIKDVIKDGIYFYQENPDTKERTLVEYIKNEVNYE